MPCLSANPCKLKTLHRTFFQAYNAELMKNRVTVEHLSYAELRSSIALSSVFALRMLGLFLVLPVFAVFARTLPGGTDTFLVGLTLGIYGLTQGILQIPFGLASDRLGRKPVIIAGLLIFALGSAMAAFSNDILGVLFGRALQGAGAISAAVTAMIADCVRPCVLTPAMTFVGSSIGLTFAFSLVAAPPLAQLIGVEGLFLLTAILCVLAIGVMLWVPAPKKASQGLALEHAPWMRVVFGSELLRLNLGIFLLHTILMALFVSIPLVLESLGLAVASHWTIYLPTVLASFFVALPSISYAERHGRIKTLFLVAILSLALTLILFRWAESLWSMTVLLLAFFVFFNMLEAILPALVAKTSPKNDKGLALGVYNTTQSIGLFVGGALGGWIHARYGAGGVCAFASFTALAWFGMAFRMRTPCRS